MGESAAVSSGGPQIAEETLRNARIAALGGFLLVASQVASKAARDASFLGHFDASDLPRAMVLSATLSLVSTVFIGRLVRSLGPGRVIGRLLFFGAFVFVSAGALHATLPGAVGYGLYLHIGMFGAVSISAFWSVVSERFNPYAARRLYAQIAAGATLGGVVGGLLAEWLVAAFDLSAVLYAVALISVGAAVVVQRFERRPRPRKRERAIAPMHATPLLRGLALLAGSVALTSALLDFALRAHADAALQTEAELTRFFARYYIAISLLSFLIQSAIVPWAMRRRGVAVSLGILPSLGFLGSLGAMLTGTFAATAGARALVGIIENSFFRSAYEVLYSPLANRIRRRVKVLIDVGATRFGDMLGGLAILCLLAFGSVSFGIQVALGLAAVSSAIALFFVLRVRKGYVEELRAGLRRGDPALEAQLFSFAETRHSAPPPPGEPSSIESLLAELKVAEDQSAVKRAQQALSQALENDPEHAAAIVRGEFQTSEDESFKARLIGPLAKAAPEEELVTLALNALRSERFELRYRAGRALYSIVLRAPQLRPKTLMPLVEREVEISESAWAAQRAIGDTQNFDDGLGARVAQRSDQCLEHVFNLLMIAMDDPELGLALSALSSEAPALRGTALEYLDHVLPRSIRVPLYRHIAGERAPSEVARKPEEIVDELLLSMRSLQMEAPIQPTSAQARDNATEEEADDPITK